eukprot:jgi/Mesvir1/17643/Mv08861-RA.1
MDDPAFLLTLERACDAFQDAAQRSNAEKMLTGLRHTPGMVRPCLYVLQHSKHYMARFHAASILREACIRDWSKFSAEEHNVMRSTVIQFAIMLNPEAEGHVLGKLVDVVAVMIKRGWEDDPPEQRHALFTGLEAALRGQHGLGGQAACLSLLRSIVVEFAGSSASPLGLPADFHMRCKAGLEQSGLLRHFFVAGRDAAGQVAGVLAGPGDSSGGGLVAGSARVCLEGIKLVSQVLAWDFDYDVGAEASARGFGTERREWGGARDTGGAPVTAAAEHQVTLIRPGEAWRELLAGPARISWAVDLYALVRSVVQQGKGGVGPARPVLLALAAAVRHLLIQLASLTGTVFAPETLQDPSSSPSHIRAHAGLLLRASASWLSPVTAAVQRARESEHGEGELVDVLSMWQATAATCPATWGALAGEGGSNADYFALLAEMAQEVLAAGGGGGAASCGDNSWAEEGFAVIGGTLLSLLAAARAGVWQQEGPLGGMPLSPGQHPEGRLLRAVQAVFHTFVSSQMGAAAAGALAEDEGEQERCAAAVEARDECFALAAALARATPLPSLRFLLALVDQRRGMLSLHARQAAASRGADASGADIEKHVQCLEELHWLLLIVGHVLADAGGGELPCVPEEFFGSKQGHTAMGAGMGTLGQHNSIGASGAVLRGPSGDLLPSPLQAPCSSEEANEVAEQLLNLSHAALAVTFLCLDSGARAHALSPRIMEAAVWLAARWADTFLMLGATDAETAGEAPSAGYPPLLVSRLGGAEGEQLLHSLTSVVLTSLTAWPGETDLHMAACGGLLRALVRRPPVCVCLLRTDLWQQLCRAVCSCEGSLASLAARVQRALMECLVQAAAGLPSDESSTHATTGMGGNGPSAGLPSRLAYVTSLLQPVALSLVQLAAMPDLTTAAHRVDRIHMAGYMLEALRGGVSVPLPGVPGAALATCAKEDVLAALLQLGTAYRHSSLVTRLFLKASERLVEACLGRLQVMHEEGVDHAHAHAYRHTRALLLHFAAQVVTGHARHASAEPGKGGQHAGTRPSTRGTQRGAGALGTEQRSEASRHLCSLLRLLGHLVAHISVEGWASSLEDAQARQAGLSGDLPHVVSEGVQAVAPLITPEVLLYPKVCSLYFRLVGALMQAFASHLDRLPGPTLATLVQSLEYGIRHTDANVARPSLEALGTLATVQATKGMHCAGQQGPAGGTSGSSVDAEVLRHFLRVLLQMLFLEENTQGLLEPACYALLPLLLWDQGVSFPGFVRALCIEHGVASAASPQHFAHSGMPLTGDLNEVQTWMCTSMESLMSAAASLKEEYLQSSNAQRQTSMSKFRGRRAALDKFRACLRKVISENWSLVQRRAR